MYSRNTAQSEQALTEYLCGLPGFDLDVYLDVFSSEYVNNVIYNHPERNRKIQPVLDRLNIIRNVHYVFTVIFDDFWAICERKDNSYRYQLKRNLLNRTREALAEIHPYSVAATLIGTDKVVVLLECSDMPEREAEEYSYHCAEKLRDYIMRKKTYSVSIGVSNFCRSTSMAWKAYEQSFRALSGSFVSGYASILKYREKEKSDNSVSRNEVSAIARRFALAIGAGDMELCRKNANTMFQRLFVISADENYIRSCVVLVLSEIVQYCIHLGFDANCLSQRLIIMIQSVFQSGTISAIQKETFAFLLEMTEAKTNAMSGSAFSNRLNMAYAYIEQFFAEDISLRDVARLCGCSDAYFCRQFKIAYGKTYTDFLTECRIERAKQLLKEPGYSISEISEKVGFHSFSHFSMCFRKMTGMTPSKYRGSRVSG